jgi:two-component system nitrate/nitrite response regulator NarL
LFVNTPKYRILVADDDPIVRDVLRTLFAKKKRFVLVGEASDGQEAIRQTLLLKPDILFLDMLLPLLPGIETLRELTTVTVPVKTLLLCSAISKRQVIEALQLGARGVILKDSVVELEPAVDAVMAGQYWIHGEAVSNIVQALSEITAAAFPRDWPKTLGLTARELDIVSLVAQGYSNKEIATHLGIAEATVKRHLTHIFDKVGTSTRLELALFAVDRQLVTRPLDRMVNPKTSSL